VIYYTVYLNVTTWFSQSEIIILQDTTRHGVVRTRWISTAVIIQLRLKTVLQRFAGMENKNERDEHRDLLKVEP
jgi:hypothetical protein